MRPPLQNIILILNHILCEVISMTQVEMKKRKNEEMGAPGKESYHARMERLLEEYGEFR